MSKKRQGLQKKKVQLSFFADIKRYCNLHTLLMNHEQERKQILFHSNASQARSIILHKSPIYDECQTPSAKVLALPSHNSSRFFQRYSTMFVRLSSEVHFIVGAGFIPDFVISSLATKIWHSSKIEELCILITLSFILKTYPHAFSVVVAVAISPENNHSFAPSVVSLIF